MGAVSLAVHYECEFDFCDIMAVHRLLFAVRITQCVYKLQPIILLDVFHPISCFSRDSINSEMAS